MWNTRSDCFNTLVKCLLFKHVQQCISPLTSRMSHGPLSDIYLFQVFIRSARRTFGTNAGKWVQTAAWCCGSLSNINSSHYGSLHLIPGPLCLLFIHFSGIAVSAACSVSATEWIFSYRTTFICERLGSTPPFVTRCDVIFLSFGNAFCWWVRLSVCRRTLTYCVDRDCYILIHHFLVGGGNGPLPNTTAFCLDERDESIGPGGKETFLYYSGILWVSAQTHVWKIFSVRWGRACWIINGKQS